MDKLHKLWEQQSVYNKKVRAKEPESQLFWAKQYLLGLVAEIDEVLAELNWKSHRYGKPFNKYNFARELADIQKFSWCLWELYGYTVDDMLEYVEEKSDELDAQWEQDFVFKIPDNSLVVITDLDGTIGDWRKAFIAWVNATYPNELLETDVSRTMAIELDINVPYPRYIQLKEEFEASGGYRTLPVYQEVIDAFHDLKEAQVIILAYTARPHSKHSRIWNDTWLWFKDNLLDPYISELRIGAEERISRACELLSQRHKVVLLEDDPGLAIRAATAGVRVWLRAQPYNEGVRHDNIWRSDYLLAADIMALLRAQETK